MSVIVICHSNIRVFITRDICVIRDTHPQNQPYITRDRCVICDCETPFDINEHIDFRMGYIEGVGQLCLNCYDKIYYEPKVRKEGKE